MDTFSLLTSGTSLFRKKDIKTKERELKSNNNKLDDSSLEIKQLTNRQDIRSLRQKLRIKVKKGSINSKDLPPIQTFEELKSYNVPEWLLFNISNVLKCKILTPVQMQSIPYILENYSLIVNAPTGSGKTYAYAVPLLSLLKSPKKGGCRLLVIVPTRELSIQILREFDLLRGSKTFRVILFHKAKIEKQRCDIGISTPLKLVQLLRDKLLNFTNIKHIVMDEADKLLEMGFAPQIKEILSYINEDQNLQYLFFSATLPENVNQLINSVIPCATRISINNRMSAASTIDQQLKFVTDEEGKLTIFRQMIASRKIEPPTLIFLQSIDRAKDLFKELVYDGLYVDVIHSGRTKLERDNIIQGFREKKIWILICTDLMARGVDFIGVKYVISWDVPQSGISYIHRIGRTGRAGRKGTAITFFTVKDFPYMAPIISVMKESGCEIPSWLTKLKRSSLSQKSNEKRIVKRRKIYKPIPTNQ